MSIRQECFRICQHDAAVKMEHNIIIFVIFQKLLLYTYKSKKGFIYLQMFFSLSFLGLGLIPPFEPMNPAIEKYQIGHVSVKFKIHHNCK